MIYLIVVLTVILIVSFSLLESILMLSANDFVKVNELAINKKSYIQIIKLNFKKLIKAILNKEESKISSISYYSNTGLFILMIGIVSLIILDSFNIKIINDRNIITFLSKFSFLIFLVFTFLARVIGHISNYSKIDINKYFLKCLASIAVVVMNYSFIIYFVNNDDKFGTLNIIIKIILFLNLVVSVNLFDSYSKFKANNASYSQNIFDSISIYFILISGFVMLNSSTSLVHNPVKYFYYSLSILLIEFVSSYIRKIIGFLKLNQNIKFLFEYLLAYFVIVFILLVGISNVI